jgi:hypothetical protein
MKTMQEYSALTDETERVSSLANYRASFAENAFRSEQRKPPSYSTH